MGSSLSCQKNDNAEAVFEDLFEKFNDNYVGFACRGVDWQKQYDMLRPRVNQDTTQEELISVLKDMLKPLKDGHVNLTCEEMELDWTPAEGYIKFYENFGLPELDADGMQQFFNMVDATLSSAGFGEPTLLLDGVFSYCRSENFGYFRVRQFSPAEEPSGNIVCRLPAMAAFLSGWGQALDQILEDFESTKGIMLDLRGNPGGLDDQALAVASRFVDEKVLAFSTQTKTGPADDDYGETVEYFFNAEGKASVCYMDRPIFVLTSDGTFSAGEVCSLMMAQLPNVFMLGEHTYGCFSNMTPFTLCNGWNVTLSNMVYRNAAGTWYEGKGVPVDFVVPNSKADLEKGSDPVVNEALRRLKSPNPLSGNGRK